MTRWFSGFSEKISAAAGHYLAFVAALGVVLAWVVSGPFLGFSDIWQLSINTGTTIVTFLMVFVLQNSQNRTSKAIHLKLDELIVAIETARNTVLAAEQETEEDLDHDLRAELDRARDQRSSDGLSVSGTLVAAGDCPEDNPSDHHGGHNA